MIMSKVLLIVCLAIIFTICGGSGVKSHSQNEFRMCVADGLLQFCKQMAEVKTEDDIKVKCIPGRDRVECLYKVKTKEADFAIVDPEDMYLAATEPDNDFYIFEEIRTKLGMDSDYRFETVAVIRKNLPVKTLEGLRELRSCHPGIGSNAGFRIPLSKLYQKGVFTGKLHNSTLTIRENELKALSSLFSRACIPGKWSQNLTVENELKKKYHHLCALCDRPDVCDYSDKFSGNEGALRCLQKDGQIAWTTASIVKKYFQESNISKHAEDYVYLCPDGSKVPIKGTPCSWAARPWQGYITNRDSLKNIDSLRTKLDQLNTLGTSLKAPWLQKILHLNDETILKKIVSVTPDDLLKREKYIDVIETNYGPPFKSIRICTTSEAENQKCNNFSRAAFARNIRPKFDCIRDPENNIYNCLKFIRDNEADMVTTSYYLAHSSRNLYALEPILAEQYGELPVSYYGVAVVKRSSHYQSFSHLEGSKACFPSLRDTLMSRAVAFNLRKQNLVRIPECDSYKAIEQFFNESCLPGADIESHLCALCAGEIDKGNTSEKCNNGHPEAYHGYDGAFRCLARGGGDVAFIKHDTVFMNTDGKNKVAWTKNLKSSDYELLCPKGGRAPLDQYATCYTVIEPANMVVTSTWRDPVEAEETKNALLQASQLFTKYPEYFKLFGPYKKRHNLIFSDSATGLAIYPGFVETEKNYTEISDLNIECPPNYNG